MTVIPFLPSATQPFEFQPTLDGIQYTAFVKWNVFGRRYYLELYQLDGARVLTTALIGSPNDADINLVLTGRLATSGKGAVLDGSAITGVAPIINIWPRSSQRPAAISPSSRFGTA